MMNKIHNQSIQDENKSLVNLENVIYSLFAFAKSKAEPGNSTDKTLANSTPFKNRAFFVRSTRTSKENTQPKNRLSVFLSMVACNGKGYALCCVPKFAVFQPVTRYRPSLETLAVAFQTLTLELSEMKSYIFKFLSLTTGKTTPCIIATSEDEARKKLAKNASPERRAGKSLICPLLCDFRG